jgi:hypothetical protein
LQQGFRFINHLSDSAILLAGMRDLREYTRDW